MTTPEHVVPDYDVKVDGTPIAPPLREALITIRVEQTIELTSMFTLTFDNPHAEVGDSPVFAEGKEVEIELGWVGAVQTVMKGNIVSVEPHFPLGTTPYVVIRGYDKSHQMRRGKKTRTFLQQKASDVIRQLAQEEGLSIQVDDTAVSHDYLMQNNQSNLEFLHELARRHHLNVSISPSNSQLLVQKPGSNAATSHTLEWGHNLKSFYVRKSLSQVPTAVVATGWDPKTKQAISSKSNSVHGSHGTHSTPSMVSSAFGDNEVNVAIRPTSAPAEAEAMATAQFNAKALDAIQGHGTLVGDLDVTPGSMIELAGLGGAWTGNYYVTAVTHILDRATGFVTEFHVKRSAVGQVPQSPPRPPAIPPYNAQPVTPPPTFVEVELVSVDGASLEGHDYKITLPDGRVQQGKVDSTGKVRVEGIKQAGDVKVEIKTKDGHHVPDASGKGP